MFKQYKLRNYHFQLILYLCALTIIGILVIGSAEKSVQNKQILGFALGLFIMIFLSLIDYSFILRFSWLYYIGIIILLVMVKIAGKTVGGSQRWIIIAGIQFQPSELAKIVIILFFAYFFMKYEKWQWGRNNRKNIFLINQAVARGNKRRHKYEIGNESF